MLCDLAGRTSPALLHPAEDVTTHALPRVRPGDDGEGGLPGRMSQIVDGEEHWMASVLGDEHPRSAQRRVTYDGAVDAGKTKAFEPERGGRFVGDGALKAGEFGEADVGERVRDGMNDGRLFFVVVLSREGVRHHVVESGDVRDVRREFADESELVALAAGDRVEGLEKCARQRLLVCKNFEFAALE